ncbi:fungal-specific transcription factor domain-domain-containing protein [Microdochium bolleyi]|uniref:Fungal-specific transcription factor domain-domain-containing protein n=1 Tax=Microdochium bolleyi TaxID=196109 RepID=A0A136JGF9_9PEZI|nr:fungal-specific transcription factor domain-domain-containing protein [Microdochium bolleyi]
MASLPGQQHRLRSLRGCWTCRLRRKKCDEARPVCVACSGLEITCNYGEGKPAWMDGGRREKDKAAEVKAAIKARAAERRDRKWAVMLEPETRPAEPRPAKSTASPSPMSSPAGAHESPDTAPTNYSTTPAEDYGHSDGSAAIHESLAELCESPRSSDHDGDLERETNHIMVYLDHVFPFFFPFYRPRLISGTRGWLLFLLLREKAIFHTALSLSSYFGAVAFHSTRDRPTLQREAHNACQAVSWTDLVRHQELAIRQLQADVSRLSQQSNLRDSIRGLQSIIQLLEFEIAIAKKPTPVPGDDSGCGGGSGGCTSWLSHLNAALELFNQILSRYAPMEPSQEHPWDKVAHQISHVRPGSQPLDFKPPLSNSEMALNFYTARLLYIDVLAATALERMPSLQPHHAHLLGGWGEREPAIRLEEYIGLENWVVLATADVVELAVWKRQMKVSGQLSVVELVRRASSIEAGVRMNIRRLAPILNAATTPHNRPHTSSPPATCLLPSISREKIFDPSAFRAGSHAQPFEPHNTNTTTTNNNKNANTAAVALHSTIFAHAALIYLSTVVSGMQPSLPEIQSSLTAMLCLLELLPTASCLRTLLWPFAVAGCVAVTPEQRAVFETAVDEMGDMAIFGPVREALDVVREVWRIRDGGGSGSQEDWSVAGCLNILGHASLLA